MSVNLFAIAQNATEQSLGSFGHPSRQAQRAIRSFEGRQMPGQGMENLKEGTAPWTYLDAPYFV
jgi:hypothetical protein